MNHMHVHNLAGCFLPIKRMVFVGLLCTFAVPVMAQDMASPFTQQVKAIGEGTDTAEAASPTAVTLTPEEIQKLAKDALEKRNLALAEKLADNLPESFTDFKTYTQARVHTLRGNYTQALEALNTLHMQRDADYHPQASILRGDVLLTLAFQNQQAGNLEAAEQHLRSYLSDHRDHKSRDVFESLMRAQSRMTKAAPHTNRAEAPLRVALLLPLSGKYKQAGKTLLNSALLSLFEQSVNNLQIMPLDTAGTPEGARMALQHALSYGVDMVMGPLLSSSVSAIAPFTRTSGRPVMAFSSDHHVASDNIFLMSFMPAEQGRLMARHAVENGHTSLAALVPDNPYGSAMLRAFDAEAQRLGAQVVRTAYYNPVDVDLSKPMRALVQLNKAEKEQGEKIAALEKEYDILGGAMNDASLTQLKKLKKMDAQPIVDFEALFVPAPATVMPLIAPQLAFYDIDAKNVFLVGNNQWNNDKVLLKNRGEYLRGAHFPASDREAFAKFSQSYKSIFGVEPSPLGALSHDGIAVLAELMHLQDVQATNLRRHLTRKRGFRGVTGAFRFNNEGVTDRAYEMLAVGSRSFRQVQPAPKVMPPELPEDGKGWRGLLDPFSSGNFSFFR